MADYYSQFSMLMQGLSTKEAEWLEGFLATPSDEILDDEKLLKMWLKEHYHKLWDSEYPENWCTLDYNISVSANPMFYNAVLCSFEGGEDQAAVVAHAFLKKFRPHDYIELQIGHTCSKPRTDGFGGQCAFITAERIAWHSTHDWLYQMTSRWKKRLKKNG